MGLVREGIGPGPKQKESVVSLRQGCNSYSLCLSLQFTASNAVEALAPYQCNQCKGEGVFGLAWSDDSFCEFSMPRLAIVHAGRSR